MVQVSLIAYAAGGAFLGLAYFDLYYHLIAIILIGRGIAEKYLQEQIQVQVWLGKSSLLDQVDVYENGAIFV